MFFWPCFPISGVAPANQTKERSVHELFTGAFPGTKVQCESCLFSKGKKPEFTKWARFMNFSFGPFFGLVCRGRLLIFSGGGRNPYSSYFFSDLGPWARTPLPLWQAGRFAMLRMEVTHRHTDTHTHTHTHTPPSG